MDGKPETTRRLTKEQIDRMNRNGFIYSYAVVALFVWLATSNVSAVILSVIARTVLSDVSNFLGLHDRWVALWSKGESQHG